MSKQYAEEVESEQAVDDGWIIRRDAQGILHLHDKKGTRWGTITSIEPVSSGIYSRQVLNWQITMAPGLRISVSGTMNRNVPGELSRGPARLGHTRKLGNG